LASESVIFVCVALNVGGAMTDDVKRIEVYTITFFEVAVIVIVTVGIILALVVTVTALVCRRRRPSACPCACSCSCSSPCPCPCRCRSRLSRGGPQTRDAELNIDLLPTNNEYRQLASPDLVIDLGGSSSALERFELHERRNKIVFVADIALCAFGKVNQ